MKDSLQVDELQAWPEELLRFAALWLGRKTQTFSGTSQKPGQPRPCNARSSCLENVCPAFSPDPTDCPWVSDDDFTQNTTTLIPCVQPSPPLKQNRGERRLCRTRFFSEEGRICAGYYTDWRFYCFHWSLTKAWPQGFPRMISLRIRLHDSLSTAVPFPQTKSTRETSVSQRLSP